MGFVENVSSAIEPGDEYHTETTVDGVNPARAAFIGVTTAMIGFCRFQIFFHHISNVPNGEFSKETLKPTFVSVIGIVSVFTNEVIIVTVIQIDSLATCRDRITIDSITMKALVTLTCKTELSVSAGGIRVTVVTTIGAFIFWDDFNTVVTSIEFKAVFTTALEFSFVYFFRVSRTV